VNVLDTDALSHLQKFDPVGVEITARLAACSDPDFRITTVSAYEMLGGAFDLIRDLRKKGKALIPGFQLFQELLDYLTPWQGRILRYDDEANVVYQSFTPRLRQNLNNDARIAAIAMVHGAAVWTCNVDDYKQIPGLIVYAAETGMLVS
jgi:predicted nucleic acid-binding protein